MNRCLKKILLATDGSDASEKATTIAIGLAQEQKAELLIVHVVDLYAMYFATPESIEFLVSSGQNILNLIEKRAQKVGVVTHTKRLQTDEGGNHIGELVLGESAAWEADLLVVGSHGRRGLNHFLIGSVADWICQRARIPVLLAR
ncbi:universal stress protein [Acidithiobacillus thiooxidans]|uniref:universal stress protein n=1 Tax=Acidithiobacillus thiooxidans TaxID=930 RepID=UPI0004662E24|nr:universal stress protein [Acidithiobacillus thiooxidans]